MKKQKIGQGQSQCHCSIQEAKNVRKLQRSETVVKNRYIFKHLHITSNHLRKFEDDITRNIGTLAQKNSEEEYNYTIKIE